MSEQWVSDGSQSYYLDSEEKSGSCDPLTWTVEAKSTSSKNPLPFWEQYKTTDRTTMLFSDPFPDLINFPGFHGVCNATEDTFTDTNTFLPLSNQGLDAEQTRQETSSDDDFGGYNPSVWGSEANLASNESFTESTPFRGYYETTAQVNASCSSRVLDTVDYPEASVMEDLSTGTNTISPLSIRGLNMELAHQDTCSTSLAEVLYDVLSNSFACALDRPRNALRHDLGRDKELVEPAPGQRRGRKKLRAEDQQTTRNLASALSTPPWLDSTFARPLLGLKLVTGYSTTLPKSRFDMYIATLRQLVRSASETRFLT